MPNQLYTPFFYVFALFCMTSCGTVEEDPYFNGGKVYYASSRILPACIFIKDTLKFPNSDGRIMEETVNRKDFTILKRFIDIEEKLFYLNVGTDREWNFVHTLIIKFIKKTSGKIPKNNLIFYQQIKTLFLDENIPVTDSIHIGSLEKLQSVELICPNIDNSPMDTLKIPFYLNKISRWVINNIVFSQIIFHPKSKVAELSFENTIMYSDFDHKYHFGVMDVNYIDRIGDVRLIGLDSLASLKITSFKVDNILLEDDGKLERVMLYNCIIETLTVKDAMMLHYIHLNKYTVISAIRLTNLTNMEEININNNSVSDFRATNLLKTKIINLSNNNIKKISIVNAPKLQILILTDNRLEDIRIESASNLKKLFLVGNPIKDIEAVRRRYPDTEIYFTEEEYGAYRREIVASKKIYPSIRKFLTPQSQKETEALFQSDDERTPRLIGNK